MITPKVSGIKIAVVGAGISGLRCAGLLLEHGFDVTIFEARHELGGRTRQVNLNGHLVDIGANWIHGYNEDNPIANIQKKIGTIVHDFDRTSIRFNEEGRLMTKEEVLADSKLAWPAFENFMKYSGLNSKDINPKLPWAYGLKEQLKEVTDDPVQTARLLRVVEHAGAFPGEGIDKLSYKYAFMEDFTDALRDDSSDSGSAPSSNDDPENVFVAGTYHDIVQHIAKLPLEKSTFRLNTEVVFITTNTTSKPSVNLQTKNGTKFTFDDVVVTTPLGWLKQHNSIIHPALPSPILSAIHDLSFGRLEKCYIAFPHAFWHDTPVPPSNIINLSTTDDITPSHPQPSSNTNPHGPWSEASFLSPTYHPYHPPPSTSSASWPFEALTLCALPAPLSHPTLLIYLFGDAGAKISSLLAPHSNSTSAHARAERQKILRYFYEPLYSRLPGYDASRAECVPVDFVQTTHQVDPLQLGSYTCSTTTTQDALGSLAVLSGSESESEKSVMQSMGRERGFWLAGEHCAGEEWVATTVGAYISGDRVGNWIAEKYRK